ncbi:hypothetical protein Hesp01_19660 [Herbidospora sp. NBRC 101105]|nr:hypothetical protein Hesp01_19660 [Herbidospora sp. NBRC 101105]
MKCRRTLQVGSSETEMDILSTAGPQPEIALKDNPFRPSARSRTGIWARTARGGPRRSMATVSRSGTWIRRPTKTAGHLSGLNGPRRRVEERLNPATRGRPDVRLGTWTCC